MNIPIELLEQIHKSGLRNVAQAYLAAGHLVSIAENDTDCYDAIFQENGQEFFVEVTLEEGRPDYLEDCYCGKCNDTICIHTVAACLKVGEMLHREQKTDGAPQLALLH